MARRKQDIETTPAMPRGFLPLPRLTLLRGLLKGPTGSTRMVVHISTELNAPISQGAHPVISKDRAVTRI